MRNFQNEYTLISKPPKNTSSIRFVLYFKFSKWSADISKSNPKEFNELRICLQVEF